MERQQTAMLPGPPVARVFRTDSERLEGLRKWYGEEAVTACLLEKGGDITEVNRTLRRERQRTLRAGKRAARRDARSNDLLYSGPITIGDALLGIISRGREVKCKMGGKSRIRATFQGYLTGLPEDLYDGGPGGGGHHVVLYDPRVGETGAASAEVLWTGQEYRLHGWRRSPLDPRPPVALDAME